MRIVFMGTPEFAVPSLEVCIQAPNAQVVGVWTQPDRPKGRGHRLMPPPVKLCAEAHGIPVYQPVHLKDAASVAQLRALSPDLIVVVAYGQLLSKEILDMPGLGCVNVHASLLPKLRGASPIQWALVSGLSVTGVTTMYMAEGLDTGDMIESAELQIPETFHAGDLHDQLKILGARVLETTLQLVASGRAEGTPQDDSQSSYAPKLSKDMALIDWTQSAETIRQYVRGFNPWPIAFSYLSGERVRIFEATVSEATASKAASTQTPGEIIAVNADGIQVACVTGVLQIHEIQVGAGKRMAVSDYLRGNGVAVGQRFGNVPQ